MSDLTKKCPCKGDTLDKFVQPMVLIILSKRSCSGYSIVKQMAQYVMLEKGTPDTTGVYRQLKVMESKGSILQVDYTEKNGVSKKRYEITEEGMQCLKNWSETLQEYRQSINLLLQQIKECVEEKS